MSSLDDALGESLAIGLLPRRFLRGHVFGRPGLPIEDAGNQRSGLNGLQNMCFALWFELENHSIGAGCAGAGHPDEAVRRIHAPKPDEIMTVLSHDQVLTGRQVLSIYCESEGNVECCRG